VERILQDFVYDSKTGEFRNARYKGSTAPKGALSGAFNERGYLNLYIDSVLYSGHRVAWKIVHGVDPEEEIDHADGNTSNNAISNLRSASRVDNIGNQRLSKRNTSGFKGVQYVRETCRWRANFGSGPTHKYCGMYDTPEDAHAAYVAAAKKYFGRFANDGFVPIGTLDERQDEAQQSPSA
jgi:hypothetical protein